MSVDDLRHFARMASRVFRPVGEGPELLCLFVNSHCDASCAHCFDWPRREPGRQAADLSREELLCVAERLPRMYFLLLTGGEPFLRPDLPEIALAMARRAKPQVLAIPTNGGRPAAILRAVSDILEGLPVGTRLSVNVSLDGIGEHHDRIRGVPGLFARAVETLGGLQELARRRGRLGVGVVTVVSRHNQDELLAIMRHVLDDLKIPIWAPFLVRGVPRDPRAAEVDLDRYLEVSRELSLRALGGSYREYTGFAGAALNNAKNVIRREIIHETVTEGRRVVPCLAGRHSAVVWSNGEVHPCELQDRSMGNLRDFDYDLTALWHAPGATAARAFVDAAPCACSHENTLTTSVAFDWRQWPWLLSWTAAFLQGPLDAPPASPPPLRPNPRVTDRPELVCFVPAHNEEKAIVSTLRILDRVLSEVVASHEIVVIDDGSRDATRQRVEGLDNPRVRCLRFEDGPSFRGNLSRSLLTVDADYIAFMDADLSANATDMARIMARLRAGVHVVTGSRYQPGSRAVRHPSRLALSLAYNVAVRRLAGTSFRDHQCGLKAFRKEALTAVLPQFAGQEAARGWFWDAELLARCVREGFLVEEVPVVWACRIDSRSMLRRQYRMLPWMVRLAKERRR